MKKILGYLRRASEEFDMIRPGDKIAVGVSGGKDSMLLLYALSLYRRYIRFDYDLVALTVDLGFPGFDTQSILDFSRQLGIPHEIIKTDIGEIVFEIRKEHNPCSLCAKMRKGAFYRTARELGCNKAAFAHHADDLTETLLLSLFYEAKLNTFAPVTYLSRQAITLIRPFIYLRERDITGAVNRLEIPVSKNPCPASGDTRRQEIKELIAEVAKKKPDVRKNMLAAIHNTENYHLWDKPPEVPSEPLP